MAVTATDIEPAFVTERFEPAGDRLEVAGHWVNLRGRHLVRPVLWLHDGGERRRIVAVLDHKPWAARDGAPWVAAFPWPEGAATFDRAELEVGRELVVELPVDGESSVAAETPRPARPRRPSEVDTLRAQLAEARAEAEQRRRALEAATRESYAALEAGREALAARVASAEAERDAATARADAAEAERDGLATRAESAEAERDELSARVETAEARAAERIAALEGQRDAANARAEPDATVAFDREGIAERERLERQLEAAREERDRARGELTAADPAERDRLRRRLAAAEEQRDHLRARLTAAEEERNALRNQVVVAQTTPVPPSRRPPAEPVSPIGPPRSGPGLWVVRLVALAFVAVLLSAAIVVLSGVI